MSRKRSHISQKYLLGLLALLVTFLAWQTKATPKYSLRLLLSPYWKYRSYIEAMARHESGDYTNTLSTMYNNIFSMGFPSIRPSTNIGKTPKMFEGQFQSVYWSRWQAISDLILWMNYVNFPKDISSLDEFVSALAGGNSKGLVYFAQDPALYLAALESKM